MDPSNPSTTESGDHRRSVTGLVEALPELIDLLETDPSQVSSAERGDLVRGLASAIGQFDAALCLAVDAMERNGDATLDGARSVASWAAARTELSVTSGRDLKVRGRTLRDCPIVAEAHLSGVIGTAKVRMLTDARQGVEDLFARDEQILIDAIRSLTVNRARVVIGRWRELALSQLDSSLDDPEPKDPPANSFTSSATIDGNRVMSGSFDRITGAEIENLIAAEVDRRFASGDFTAADGLTASQRRAVALHQLLRRGSERSAERGDLRPSITILVDLNRLLGLQARSTAELLATRCELGDGTTVSLLEVLEQMSDATINTVLGHYGINGAFHPAGEVTSRRNASARQHRLLRARDETCVFPGCEQHGTWCDAHHTDTWSGTHETTVPRLVLLCPFHHHQVIHGTGRITLQTDDEGEITVTRADGSRIPAPPPGVKIENSSSGDDPPGAGPPLAPSMVGPRITRSEAEHLVWLNRRWHELTDPILAEMSELVADLEVTAESMAQ